MTIPDQIQNLHQSYVALTGFSLRLDSGREMVWADYVAHGFTETDLRLVVAHLKRKRVRGARRTKKVSHD